MNINDSVNIPKKRVKITGPVSMKNINHIDVKIYEDDELIEETGHPRLFIEPGFSYTQTWLESVTEDKKRLIYWKGYADFKKEDKPNKKIIMTASHGYCGGVIFCSGKQIYLGI